MSPVDLRDIRTHHDDHDVWARCSRSSTSGCGNRCAGESCASPGVGARERLCWCPHHTQEVWSRDGAATPSLLRDRRRRAERHAGRDASSTFLQPPLSRQIRDLEGELGVKLFNRSAKALWLTEAGAVFLLEARAVLQRSGEAIELTRTFAAAERGQVRVGYAAAPTIEILRAALRSFSESHPHVRVDLKEMTSQGMLRGLRARVGSGQRRADRFDFPKRLRRAHRRGARGDIRSGSPSTRNTGSRDCAPFR